MTAQIDWREVWEDIELFEFSDDKFVLHMCDGAQLKVEEAALAEIDVRLAPMIRHEAVVKTSPYLIPGMYGDAVRLTQQFWENPGHVVRDMYGGLNQFVSLQNIEESDQEDALLFWVESFVLRQFDVEINGVPQTVSYAIDQLPESFTVSKQWMETNYPGWTARWAVLESLNVPDEERPSLIFTAPSSMQTSHLELPVSISG